MFLIAITKDEIANNFKSRFIEEFKIYPFIVTILTDNFLSKFVSEPNGFSVIESPIASSSDYRTIVFSQISYDESNRIFTVFKPTISGRAIYYYLSKEGEFFCSTHIWLLRNAGVPINENVKLLPEFFIYRYIIPPQTLYENIRQLIIGEKLGVKFVNEKCKIVSTDSYRPPISQEKESCGIETIVENTLDFLEGSVQLLSPCKKQISILLSGGLDSSILFKMCQKKFDVDYTFSTGYPFENVGKNIEMDYALSAADAFQIKHKYFAATTKQYLHGFLEGILAAEEPLHHLQSVMFYLLFAEGIQKNKNIVISGQGADGVFGLPFHRSIFYSEKFKLLSKYPFLKLLKFTSHLTGKGKGISRSLNNFSLPISDTNNILWSLGNYGCEDWVCKYFNAKKFDIIEGRYNVIKPFENFSIYDRISILDLLGEVSVTQSIWSKLGESHGKILYYPFVDTNLLNYIFSIPWGIKLKKPKNILRNVARQLEIPKFIINRPKSAFGIQAKSWSEKKGALSPLVSLAAKVIDEKQICSMQSSEPTKAMTFWNMLNYSIWKRLCINNEPLEILLEELDEKI